MFPPEFIPVEMRGISIITAMILFFLITGAIIGARIYFWWDKREHSRLHTHTTIEADYLSDKISVLFTKFDENNKNMSDMNMHIAGMHEAVDWIKKFMESKVK